MQAIQLQTPRAWPANAVHIISTSGGKDSTSTILYAREEDIPYRAVFADTGNEHPLTYEYLEYLEYKLDIRIERVKADFHDAIMRKRKFISQDSRQGLDEKGRSKKWSREARKRAKGVLRPTGIPFLDLCLWKGRFPSTKRRFCTEFLKHIPIFDEVHFPELMAGKTVVSWQGVRRDESEERAKLPEVEGDEGEETQIITFRPLLDWNAEEVFAMQRRHGVKPNPLYKMGMGRVGCMPCINATKDEIFEIQRRFPEVIDRVREWEHLVSLSSKRQESTFFPADKIPDKKVAAIDDVVTWSKTVDGGRQGGRRFDLLKIIPAPVCTSHYGLCE